jgi:hypothetical protein
MPKGRVRLVVRFRKHKREIVPSQHRRAEYFTASSHFRARLGHDITLNNVEQSVE